MKLRIRNTTIIVPDDSIDIEVDKRVLTEFFMLCGAKKVQAKSQGTFLSLDNKKYSSCSTKDTNLVSEDIQYCNCAIM